VQKTHGRQEYYGENNKRKHGILCSIILRCVFCLVCLRSDDVTNRISKLVSSAEGKFLGSTSYTSGEEGNDKENADWDCVQRISSVASIKYGATDIVA
jgi:hypothetical protein